MLKELFMALEMINATRNLQQQIGAISSIHTEADESLERVTVNVMGEKDNLYVNYSNLEAYDERTAKDILTVWNYWFNHNSGSTWEMCTDADGTEYEFGYWNVNDTWFMVSIYE